jgi:L-2-hydroxyglutarate oxidase
MPELTGECDLLVVGAGIVGLATARELQRRHPENSIIVLERESDIAQHQTGSNSGVAHAGIYYKPGSLKAKLCVDGIRAMYDFCDEFDVKYERCGKLIVALSRDELGRLEELERRGKENSVEGLRRVGPDEIAEIEPHSAGIDGLHSPLTGIVDFPGVARALAKQLQENGATISTSTEVLSMDRVGGRTRVLHSRGEVAAKRVITCAGAWSDRVAVAAGADPDPRIVPFRGAYLKLKPERRELVRGLIYPVPDPDLPFLGVHLTKRVDQEVLLGPTALIVGALDAYSLKTVRAKDLRATLAWPGTWKVVGRFWKTGLKELKMAASRDALVEACAKYVPELTPDDVTDGPAGVRAQAVGRDGALVEDFVFSDAGGALHVRNAPSPAATSSLAIAKLIADRADEAA